MKIKRGVSLNHIRPEIIPAIIIAKDIVESMGREFTITSITEGKHRLDSLHYTGRAFDFRSRNMTPTEKDKCAEQLAALLGDEFDVVKEATHIHCEWDLK